MVGRLTILALVLAVPVVGQGVTQNPPVLNGLSLKSYAVDVDATETMATVVVEQIFYNPGARMAEADFFFPLPAGAAASGLELKMGGKYYGGNLLPETRARSIYDQITRRFRDPALLECTGKDLYRCRVFPVPARADASVRFAYRQPLVSDGTMRKLVLPLDATRFNRAPARKFSLTVRISTDKALQAIFCPTHAVTVKRIGLNKADVTLEARGAYLAGDLAIHYAVEDAPLGAVVSSYRPHAGRPGYFVLSLDAAFAKEKQKKAARDVVVAVDTSNSSGRNGVDTVAVAVADALATLRPKDRYSLMAFSTEPRVLCDFTHPGGDMKATIREMFAKQPASGRTRLGAAMIGASRQARSGRAGAGIILVTDGLETAPGADPVVVARDVAASGHRIGVCGVGHGVDAVRVDALGNSGEGDSAHPVNTRDLAKSVVHLLETTRAVPLTDIVVEVGGAMSIYPQRQRMLHPGEAILVAGRYAKGGEVTVRVSSKVSGERVVRNLKVTLAKRGGEPAVARMWASRRVGHLLDEARAKGDPGLHKEEIAALGRKHGIVTPHTSLLVLEENDQRNFLNGMKRQPLMNTKGGGAIKRRGTVTSAVNKRADLAKRIRALKRCTNGAADPFADLLGKNRARVRRAAGEAFYKSEDGTWVQHDLVGQDTSAAKKIKFLGEEWKRLAAREARLARILALGQKVLFVLEDGTMLQVVK